RLQRRLACPALSGTSRLTYRLLAREQRLRSLDFAGNIPPRLHRRKQPVQLLDQPLSLGLGQVQRPQTLDQLPLRRIRIRTGQVRAEGLRPELRFSPELLEQLALRPRDRQTF